MQDMVFMPKYDGSFSSIVKGEQGNSLHMEISNHDHIESHI